MRAKPLIEIVQNPWSKFLSMELTAEVRQALQKHERIGRPLGSGQFTGEAGKEAGAET
ncbi:MAG: hypothetical protein R6V39_03230 [Desulfovibrionales bacterium]